MTQTIPPRTDRDAHERVARFFTLGRVRLDVLEGEDRDGLATQTKQLAVLVYLCRSRPRGLRQRDELVAMFWPELSQDRARGALRGAIHKLRRVLGAESLQAIGDDQIGVDPARVWCDATALEDALAVNDPEAALSLYEGDFLPGFFVADAPEFEQWVDRERARLRTAGRDAALACVQIRRAAGELASAVEAARAALEIDSYHEPSLRELIELLAECGDRTGALVVAERFESRIGAELGGVLSPETRDLVQRLRAGVAVGSRARVTGRRARPRPPVASPPEAPAADSGLTNAARPRSRRSLAIAAAVVVVGGAAIVAGRLGLASTRSSTASKPATNVYVAQFESVAPNDSTAQMLALMTSDWIGQGLSSPGGPRITLSTGRASKRDSSLAEAKRAGAELALVGRVYRDGASLLVGSELIRVSDGNVLRVHPVVPVAETSLVSGADSLRRLAMASVATAVELPPWAISAVNRHLPSYEAFRAYLAGREAVRVRNMERAGELFMRASELDTGFTEPLRDLIWMRMAFGKRSQADSMLTILERRNGSEPRAVQLSDALARARLRNSANTYEAVVALNDELGVPKNAEARVYEEGNALVFARRMRAALDRLLPNPEAGSARTGVYAYWVSLGHAYHQLGNYQAELDAARAGMKEYPGHLSLRGEEVRALAALGMPADVAGILDAVTGAAPGPATWNSGSVFAIAAREARTHGLPAVESDARRRLVGWAGGLSMEERAREGVYFGLSSLLYGGAAWPELAAQADLKLSLDSVTIAWHGYRGVAAAMMGDSARARREDVWLASLTDAQLRRGLSRSPPAAERALWRALIAGALGDRSRAMSLLREAGSRGFVVDIEFHTDPIIGRFADDPAVKAMQPVR